MADKDLALPKGSLILVTGATGYIASHIVKEALKLGYRVRGTVRSEDKAESMKRLFNSPNYETAIVKDFVPEGTFDEAVKGANAVIHVASVTNFDPDPNRVIPDTVSGATSIMNSAMKEPSITRFVFTSSSTAATVPKPNEKFFIDKNMWNEDSDSLAWAPPPYNMDRAFPVYAASKTAAEKAVWQFVKEKKPHYVVNTILPDTNLGTVLTAPGATGRLVTDVYQGKLADWLPPQYAIDVIDDARIHLGAAMDSTVANERIFAFAEPFNWNDILACLRELRPHAKLLDQDPSLPRDLSTVDNALAVGLLRKWFGQPGFTSLMDMVRNNMEGVE